MATGAINPVPIQQYFDTNGDPLAGGKLFFYLAGTSTLTPVYADIGMTTPLSNPVILDSAGRAPEIFLDAKTYKEVLQTAANVTVWTADNVTSPTAIPPAPGPEPDPAFIAIVNGGSNVFDVVLPTPRSFYFVRVYATGADITIRSMTLGRFGDQVLIENSAQSTANVWLSWVASGFLAPLENRVSSGPTPLAAAGSALYVLDGGTNRWLLAQHDQGKAIAVPYNATNFGGTGGGWTVPAGSVGRWDYRLMDRTLQMHLYLDNTTLVGAPTTLNLVCPYTLVQNQGDSFYYYAAPDYGWGLYQQQTQDQYVRLYRDILSSPYANNATGVYVRAVLTLLVI